MSKMKQATLFSLKSWKKVAVEDIVKYKDILDKQNETDAILRTLIILKKKNPTKDSLLSSGIDSTLKQILKNHSSPIIASEVKKLLVHWKLDDCPKDQNDVSNKKPSLPECKVENSINIKVTDAVRKNSESVSVAHTQNVIDVSKMQSKDERATVKVCAKFEEKDVQVFKVSPINEDCKTNIVKPVYKIQSSKHICKKQSINELRKKEITRRLLFAMQIFMEEVGKQEVKKYLEELV